MFSMLFLGKYVLERIYVKLLVSFANMSTKLCLDYLSSLNLMLKGCNVSVATSIINRIFLVGSTLMMQSENMSSLSILWGQIIKVLSLNLFQQNAAEVHSKALT